MSNLENFLIEANPRFNIIPSDASFVLQNCSESIQHVVKSTSSISDTQIDFTINTNNRFLDRRVSLFFKEIPITITRVEAHKTGAADTVITSTNYIETFLEDFKDICFSEMGMLSAINLINTNLDGKDLTVHKPGKQLRSFAYYYDKESLHTHLAASSPDLFYDHRLHETGNISNELGLVVHPKGTINTISSDGKTFLMKRPKFNNLNPYDDSGLDNVGASRIPNLKWTGISSDKKVLSCSLLDVEVFLPCSIWTLGIGDNLPLYNLDNVNIGISLKNNWVKFLFCTRPTGVTNAFTFTDFSFDHSLVSQMLGVLHYKTYTPPQYIKAKMNPALPYYMNYPMIDYHNTVHQLNIDPLDLAKASVTLTNLKAIPKKIKIECIPKYSADFDHTKAPNYYGRIDALSINLNGVVTSLGTNATQIFNLAKSEGLTLSKEVALYSKGFPLMIDVSNSLSTVTNTLIGSQGGPKSLEFDISVRNLNALKEVTYEICVSIIYDSVFAYSGDAPGQKFDVYDTLLPSEHRSVEMHIDTMYAKTVQNMNMIGGSFWSVIGDGLKRVGTGLKNLITGAITNKNGFRDAVVKQWNNEGGAYSSEYPGGAVIHNSNNRVGGKSIQTWAVRK
jgi:hypothetical protein